MIPEIARAGLIDLDYTFFFQMLVFLVFLGAMTHFAFKPLLRLFERRREMSVLALEESRNTVLRTGRLEESVQVGLTEARQEGSTIKAGMKAEAQAKQETVLGKEKGLALEKMQEAREGIEADIQAAHAQLEDIADELSVGLAKTITRRESLT